MSNHVVMLFYIYTLKLNETYLIPLHVHGVQKKTYDINNNSCLKKNNCITYLSFYEDIRLL